MMDCSASIKRMLRRIFSCVHSKRAGKVSKRDDSSYSRCNDNDNDVPPSSSPSKTEDFSLCAYVCRDISIVRDAKEVVRKRESQDAQTELSHIRDQVQKMNRNYKRDIQQIKDLLIELKAEKVVAVFQSFLFQLKQRTMQISFPLVLKFCCTLVAIGNLRLTHC